MFLHMNVYSEMCSRHEVKEQFGVCLQLVIPFFPISGAVEHLKRAGEAVFQ